MSLLFFIKGLILGFSAAAPIGPIGVLCIRRSLIKGRMSGLVTGLGAAFADLLYGCLAASGIAAVSAFLVNQQRPLQFIGVVYLAYLGVKTIVQNPNTTENNEVGKNDLLKDFLSSFILLITNPATIMVFVALFSGLGLAGNLFVPLQAFLLVAGVFIGSAAWWLILSFGAGFFRQRLNNGSMLWINRLSGLVILAFALILVVGLFSR